MSTVKLSDFLHLSHSEGRPLFVNPKEDSNSKPNSPEHTASSSALPGPSREQRQNSGSVKQGDEAKNGKERQTSLSPPERGSNKGKKAKDNKAKGNKGPTRKRKK
jgi:hypothetical protein